MISNNVVVVTCDGCNQDIYVQTPVWGAPYVFARYYLKTKGGWVLRKKKGQASQDICPDCVKVQRGSIRRKQGNLHGKSQEGAKSTGRTPSRSPAS